jgi:hypothetical protein
MNRIFGTLAFTFFYAIISIGLQAQTLCNPLNLPSKLDPGKPVSHAVSDPTIVLYKNNYYLFASSSGGYWYSADLVSWTFVTTPDLPFEKQAPTAAVIGDWLYFFTSYSDKIYRTNDPVSGKWEVYNNAFPMSMISDVAVLADTDGRVYCYYGCTNDNRLMMRELDAKDRLNPIKAPVECIRKNPYEQNLKKTGGKPESPPVVGSSIVKYGGKYYYQGSEFNTAKQRYVDVVYVADKPYGPFTLQESNPVSEKEGGFLRGGNMGSFFSDKHGNWWRVVVVSDNGHSTNRIALFPGGIDNQGVLYTDLAFGDYPINVPTQKYSDANSLYNGWALLSYNKYAQASSHSSSHPASAAFDEDMATYWSASNNNKYEWLMVDLESPCTVNAVQVNLVENTSWIPQQDTINSCRYLVEYSTDKKNWKPLVDKQKNKDQLIHQFEVIGVPVQAQYIRISNYYSPYSAFGVSDLRIFGTGVGEKPKPMLAFFASRNFYEPNNIKLQWKKNSPVTGYIIRYGTQKDKLYQSMRVYSDGLLNFKVLNKNRNYWFQIDSFNENGISNSIPHSSH